MKTPEICDEELRRQLVRDHRDPEGKPDLNGIDYVEVSDDQRTLHVYFLGKAPKGVTEKNIVITGGRRVTGIKVIDIDVCRLDDKDLDDCMKIIVDRPGDFSDYILRFVEVEHGQPTDRPLHGFDPRFAEIVFSFKAGCKSDLDCLPREVCPPEPLPQPEISYLAKDYASFRQLILDRLSLVMPEWRERHVPDIGIALVELLAYSGDYLSYYQDAVATEAYLNTARQRISVRRHARLVDYLMHEGCNARAWVFVETLHGPVKLKKDETAFITGHNNALPESSRMLTHEDLRRLNLRHDQYDVFEIMFDRAFDPGATGEIQFLDEHNEILFYTWGDYECCLPRGATSATLADAYVAAPQPSPPPPPPDECDEDSSHQHNVEQPAHQAQDQHRPTPDCGEPHLPKPKRALSLHPGDVLIFEEVISPTTGEPADADLTHRHAVLLTKVTQAEDHLTKRPVVEIEWAEEDALPFTLCLSAISDAPDCERLENISIARGNVVLVDHGRTIGRKVVDDEGPEDLGSVPAGESRAECSHASCSSEVTVVAGRFRPRLKEGPLTFGQPLPAPPVSSTDEYHDQDEPPCPKPEISAALMLRQDPRLALPQINLKSTAPGDLSEIVWKPRYDLLASAADDNHFVAEMDNRARAHLRFGDGELGRAPLAAEHFITTYRVGNGAAGNVGAEAISHIVLKNQLGGVLLRPRNPMAAAGGVESEPMDEVRLFAPYAFRADRQRAVTAEDYEELAQRHPRVQRAKAVLRWTGAWYEVMVAVDPRNKAEADEELLRDVECLLRQFRRIGHELKVVKADYVPLDIEMTVCVKPGYLAGHVKAELLELFGTRKLADGRVGYFHPDNLTFGLGIMISRLVGLAQSVTGVENVVVTRLQRLGEAAGRELVDGILKLGPTEIARLDNDPIFPENGRIVFNMAGGR